MVLFSPLCRVITQNVLMLRFFYLSPPLNPCNSLFWSPIGPGPIPIDRSRLKDSDGASLLSVACALRGGRVMTQNVFNLKLRNWRWSSNVFLKNIWNELDPSSLQTSPPNLNVVLRFSRISRCRPSDRRSNNRIITCFFRFFWFWMRFSQFRKAVQLQQKCVPQWAISTWN